MIQINSKFPYPARRITFFPPNNPKHTSFSIGIKIKDSVPPKYENYKCMFWNQLLDIHDGDKVNIKSIEQAGLEEYNGNYGVSIVCKVDIIKADAPQYATEENYIAIDEPTINVSQSDSYLTMDEDSEKLPFDL